jgi:F-type H+-transporting ATPase subunit delta
VTTESWGIAAAMKTASLGAARRYARALLDVALEAAEPEAVRGELLEAVRLLTENRDLWRFLAHPAVGVEKKKKVVAAVWADGRASSLLQRLFLLLAERGRFALVPHIATAFGDLWNAHRRVFSADVVSATPLAAEQRTAIVRAVQEATGTGVETRETVDPSVLGGVRVTVAGRTYDGTVRQRLRALRETLVAGAETA